MSISPLIIVGIVIVLIFIISLVIGFFGDKYLSKKQGVDNINNSTSPSLGNSTQVNLGSTSQVGTFTMPNQVISVGQNSTQEMQQPIMQNGNDFQNINATSQVINQPQPVQPLFDSQQMQAPSAQPFINNGQVQPQPVQPLFDSQQMQVPPAQPFVNNGQVEPQPVQPLFDSQQLQAPPIQSLFDTQQVQGQQNMVNPGAVNENPAFISNPQTGTPVSFDGNVVNDDPVNNIF